MPTVADYDVVFDNRMKLGVKAGENHTSPVETLEVTGINLGSRQVLSWVLDPGTSGIKYDISINGNGLGPFAGSASDPYAVQEVVNPGFMHDPVVDNKLIINVTDGDGFFSGMVLWFQTTI